MKALKLSAFLANLLLTPSDREFFVEAAFFLDQLTLAVGEKELYLRSGRVLARRVGRSIVNRYYIVGKG